MDEAVEDSILIPIRTSAGQEVVEVPVSQLPEDVDQIIGILQAEIAPLDIWIRFAVEYHKRGDDEAAKEILEEGADPEVEKIEEYKQTITRIHFGAYSVDKLILGKNDLKAFDESAFTSVEAMKPTKRPRHG